MPIRSEMHGRYPRNYVPEHCDDGNLAAMCQACHLAYDADLHAATVARNRAARLVAPGQIEIPLSEGDPT